MIGDCDHYFSPYIFGVNQGMSRLGHWHSQVNMRQPFEVIAQRVLDVKPDILWTHMLLWAPIGSPSVDRLVDLCRRVAKNGTKVVIHDGDYKSATRYPNDISEWCAAALCNHQFDRSAWKCPVLYWPYFAFAQELFQVPEKLDYGLFFAGTVRADATYAARSQLLEEIRAKGVDLSIPPLSEGNTLFRTAEIATASQAVLGFGRPGVTGWVDTRVFQYPGAGAILLHDEAPQLIPWEHYVPYVSGNAESVAAAYRCVEAMSSTEQMNLRSRAFDYVQRKHSSVARVKQVIEFIFEEKAK